MNSRDRSILSADQQTWAGRRVLITGATGFIGQRLTRRLAASQASITVTVCVHDTPELIAALPHQIDRRTGDVRDLNQMSQLVRAVQPDVVFHLAAVGVNEPFVATETALQVNLQGTLNTLQAVQSVNADQSKCVQRIVVAGTSYEYGSEGRLDPGNVYAASKVAAWAFCRMHFRAHGTPVVIARPFNVYGAGQMGKGLVSAAIRAALSEEDFATTPGEQRRDFVHVDDIVDGFLALATAPGIEGESLDLGTGQTTSVRDLVENVYGLCASSGRPKIGALPYRPGVVWELRANAEKTHRLTGWRAQIGLEEGLKRAIQAFPVG